MTPKPLLPITITESANLPAALTEIAPSSNTPPITDTTTGSTGDAVTTVSESSTVAYVPGTSSGPVATSEK